MLFLTARDDTDDKVTGLTVGGDDYVTKPFSLDEVVARIRAVLRRTQPHDDDDAVIRVDDLELDDDAHEVRRGGEVIDLSPTEFKLLRYLMMNPNRVLSKAQILDHVWEYDFNGDASIVESYISYLRRKIDRTRRPGADPDQARRRLPAAHRRQAVAPRCPRWKSASLRTQLIAIMTLLMVFTVAHGHRDHLPAPEQPRCADGSGHRGECAVESPTASAPWAAIPAEPVPVLRRLARRQRVRHPLDPFRHRGRNPRDPGPGPGRR